ncbi:MAG TPA: RNA 2',3'-cyclic phosphodiesterase [Bacillota bacterium]|nr:RNA 2',3'-cyclic phosphodiesterase [Bacillota bacterium]
MKRMFVALDLPDALKGQMSLCPAFRDMGYRGISWVKPENMHLTLKFLGDTEESGLDRLRSALTGVAASHRAFTVSYSGVGRFGRGGYTSSIWVGVHDRTGGLARLAADIETALMPLGFEKEGRRFSPHITLCRVREGSDLPPWDQIKGSFSNLDASVLHDGFSLYESVLTREGPIYTRDSWYELKKG